MNKITEAARLIFAVLILIAAKTANAQAPLPITITERGTVTGYSHPSLPPGTPSPVTIGEAFTITTVIYPASVAPASCATPCYGGSDTQGTTTITLGNTSYTESNSVAAIILGAQSGSGYAGIQVITNNGSPLPGGVTSSITSSPSPIPDPLAYANEMIAFSSNVTGTLTTTNWASANSTILYNATLYGAITSVTIQATRTTTVFTTTCGDSSCNLTPYSESATITFPYTVPLDGSTFYGPAKLNISIQGAQTTVIIPSFNSFVYAPTTLLNGVMTHDLQLTTAASIGLVTVAGSPPTGIILQPQPGLNSADFIFATIGEVHFFEVFGTYANGIGFDVNNVVFTLSPVAALPTVTFLDPICPLTCSLLNGPQITSDLNRLSTGGVAVKGLAADGVTEVVLKVPTFNAGDKVTATLFNTDCTDSSTNPSTCPATSAASAPDDGVLLPVGSSTDTTTAARFVGYQAPIDFVRTSSVAADSQKTSRTVYIRLNYSTAAGTSYGSQIVQIQVVRPPVILVHGLWATIEPDLQDLLSLMNNSMIQVYPANYGVPITVTSSQPSYDPIVLSKATGSSLGFEYGALITSSIITTGLSDFRSGHNPINVNVAAFQVDVIAHSMGALVTRAVERIPSYFNSSNFGAGYIHKAISIGGPHLGSPLALSLLKRNRPSDNGDDNSCIRTLVAQKGFISFDGCNGCVQYQDSTGSGNASGAVGDLSGNGDGTNLSSAISQLQNPPAGHKGIAMAFVAGTMMPQQYAALDGATHPGTCTVDGSIDSCEDYAYLGSNTRVLTNLDLLKLACGNSFIASEVSNSPSSPLTQDISESGFPKFMGGDSDGIVPLASATNGNKPSAAILPGYVHSGGAEMLGFGLTTTSRSTTTLLNDPVDTTMLPKLILGLLNTPISSTVFQLGQ